MNPQAVASTATGPLGTIREEVAVSFSAESAAYGTFLYYSIEKVLGWIRGQSLGHALRTTDEKLTVFKFKEVIRGGYLKKKSGRHKFKEYYDVPAGPWEQQAPTPKPVKPVGVRLFKQQKCSLPKPVKTGYLDAVLDNLVASIHNEELYARPIHVDGLGDVEHQPQVHVTTDQLNGNQGSYSNTNNHAAVACEQKMPKDILVRIHGQDTIALTSGEAKMPGPETTCDCLTANSKAVSGSVFKAIHRVAPLKLKKSLRTALFSKTRIDPLHFQAWSQHPEIYTPSMFWRDCINTGWAPKDFFLKYLDAIGLTTSAVLESLLLTGDDHRTDLTEQMLASGAIITAPSTTLVPARRVILMRAGYDQATKMGGSDPGPKPGVTPKPGQKRDIKKEVKKEIKKEVKKDLKSKKTHAKPQHKTKHRPKQINPGEMRSTKSDTIFSESILGQDMIKAFASGKLADVNFSQAKNQIIYDGVASLQELVALQEKDDAPGRAGTLSQYMRMYTQYKLKNLTLELHMKDIANYDFEIGCCVLDALTPVDLSELPNLYELRVSEPNTTRINRQAIQSFSRKGKNFTHVVRMPIRLVDSVRYCRPGLNAMNRGLVRIILFVYQQPAFVPIASTSEYASLNPVNGPAGVIMFRSDWHFMQKIPPDANGAGYYVIQQTLTTDRTLEADVTDGNGVSREVTQSQGVAPPEVAFAAATNGDSDPSAQTIQVDDDGASDTIKAIQTFVSSVGTVVGFIFPEAAPVIAGVEICLAVASEIISTFDKMKKKDTELSEANGIDLQGSNFLTPALGPFPAASPSQSTKGNLITGFIPSGYYDQMPAGGSVVKMSQLTMGKTTAPALTPTDPSSPILVMQENPVSSQFEYNMFLTDSATGPRMLSIEDDAVSTGQIAGPESSVGGRPLFIDGVAPRPKVPLVAAGTSLVPAIKCQVNRYICIIYDTADSNALNVVPLIHVGRVGKVHTFRHVLYPNGTYIGDDRRMGVLCGFFGGSQSAGVSGDFCHSVVSYAYRGRTTTTDNANKVLASTSTLTMNLDEDHSASTQLSYCGIIDTVVELNNTTTFAGIRTPRWWFTELLTRDPTTNKLRVPILSNADSGVGTRRSPIYAINADF